MKYTAFIATVAALFAAGSASAVSVSTQVEVNGRSVAIDGLAIVNDHLYQVGWLSDRNDIGFSAVRERYVDESMDASFGYPPVNEEPIPLRRRSRADADIDDFDLELRYVGDAWELLVEYEVEIEDAHPRERFDLVIEMREEWRDKRPPGRISPVVIPLDYPTEVDDDEVKFEDRIAIRLPYSYYDHPRKLRLDATIVPRGGGRPLDHDDESVKFR